MPDILKFPAKNRAADEIVITIVGFWSGSTYLFKTVSSDLPAGDNPASTSGTFDNAVRTAFFSAHIAGFDKVRFALEYESTSGGAA